MPAFALPHVWSDTTYAGTAIVTQALPSDAILSDGRAGMA